MLNKDLLTRFRRNACTEEELRQIYRWLQDPRYEEEVSALLKHDWDHVTNLSETQPDYENLYTQILQEISRKRVRKRNPQFLYYAAASVLVILGVLAWIFTKSPDAEQAEITYIQKEAREGQKLTIRLPDGSQVMLNAVSSIRYAEDMCTAGRTVYLTGEAYFDVAKDTLHPFRVVSGDVVVTALGTAFDVRQGRELVKVALVHGVVDVHDSKKQDRIVLYPGEGVNCTVENGLQEKYTFDPKAAVGWSQGLLYFHNEALYDIFQQLENWYGVKFYIEGSASRGNRKYSGEFKNQSLEQVLEGISFTMGLTYRIKEKSVFIGL